MEKDFYLKKNFKEALQNVKGFWSKNGVNRIYFEVSKKSNCYAELNFDNILKSKVKCFVKNSYDYSSSKSLNVELKRLRSIVWNQLENVRRLVLEDGYCCIGDNITPDDKIELSISSGEDYLEDYLAFVIGGSNVATINVIKINK
ncbi:MAG: hypothetical protein LBH46_01400 [Rickettsiales bacterium]|jgi:hypothetical protein|nr:hypothetical protein [Rickettsiales bacterium]